VASQILVCQICHHGAVYEYDMMSITSEVCWLLDVL